MSARNHTNSTLTDAIVYVDLPISLRTQWAIYVTLNYLGAILCTLALTALVSNAYFNVPNRRKSRHAMHVANGALLSGCWIMSVPCATQCLLDLIFDRNTTSFGEVACKLEAYFHIVAIITQFYSNALIAGVPLFTIVTMRDVRPVAMIQLVGLIWIGSTFLTLLSTIGTRMSVQPAGAYCFPDFDSNMIRLWFAPSMLIALAFQTACFVMICRGAVRISKQAESPAAMSTDNKNSNGKNIAASVALAFATPAMRPSPRVVEKQYRVLRRLIRNAATTELIFFVGWFPAIVAFCYALNPANHNRITVRLDLGLAISGSLHSVLVPLWLFYSQEGMRRWITSWICKPPCCCCVNSTNKHTENEMNRNDNPVVILSSPASPHGVPKHFASARTAPRNSGRQSARMSLPTYLRQPSARDSSVGIHSKAVVLSAPMAVLLSTECPSPPSPPPTAQPVQELDSPLSAAAPCGESDDHSSRVMSFVITPPSVSSDAPRPKARYNQMNVPPPLPPVSPDAYTVPEQDLSDGGSPKSPHIRPLRSPNLLYAPPPNPLGLSRSAAWSTAAPTESNASSSSASFSSPVSTLVPSLRLNSIDPSL